MNEDDEKLVEIYCSTADNSLQENIFCEFVDRYHKLLISRAYWQLGNQEDAEEAVQLAWMGVLNSLYNFNSYSGSFRSWLCGILHNKAVDIIRKNKRKNFVTGEELDIVFVYSDFSSYEDEIKETLQGCISKFSPKYRDLICKMILPNEKDWSEFSTEKFHRTLKTISVLEISENFQEPLTQLHERLSRLQNKIICIGTLKTQRYRALRMLQQCLRNSGFGGEENE
ncbi:RNA polymerase sigma factor [Candidatus Uabimicrobium sp. HlEnr_7]|uniref:RNA polymerase sigma factor n=1 Tax=Candidatus Uabimicrobium helgolandensis TaxID=3095367 RepID=UPI003556FD05